jgi:hypothetical protein
VRKFGWFDLNLDAACKGKAVWGSIGAGLALDAVRKFG